MTERSPKPTQTYAIGQLVTARVEKTLPYGVFVRLDDEFTRGYIRRREMSWAGDIDPQELIGVGETVEAVIKNLGGPDRCIELSRNDALPDPWEAFSDQFAEGDVVRGTVKNLMPFGVFVQILPGVDGLVPLRELALEPVEKPDEMLWIGDDVEAVITRIEDKPKRVQLSIGSRLRQRETTAAIMRELYGTAEQDVQPGLYPEATGPGATDGDLLPTAISSAVIKRVGSILVVEDEDQVRGPLVEWLRNLGYRADAACNPEQAEERIRQHPYGLLLVDIYLPGRDGLTLVRQIQEQGCDEIRIALMSIPEWIEKYADEIQALDVLEVFTKPLILDEIEHLLLKVGSGERLPSWQIKPGRYQAVTPEPSRGFSDVTRTGTSLSDRMQTTLERLVEHAQADAGAIFHLDPLSRDISIEAATGAISLTAEPEAAYSLTESPVKDVILEGEPVFEYRMSGGVKRRFRKLLALLPFESCIGVPIEVAGETERTLFLFDQKPEAFSHHHLRDARAAAILVAAVVERESFSQQAESLGRLLLSGELAAGLGHEVYNKMSGLELQLLNLQTDYERLRQQTPGLSEDSKYRELQEAVGTLLETAQDLKRTVGVFQRLIRSGEEQELDVNQVVLGTKALMHLTTRGTGVKVKTKLDPTLPPARGRGIRLQQVFLNVMLNAMQQMHLISREGVLRVTTSFDPNDGTRPIKVRFADDGPGIHKRLWERIFSLGFSTRPGGTGLGLFIARSLVESMGGVISVEESLVPLGTTFLVELPAVVDQ